MYKFRITGYAGNGATFWSSHPVDIKVFAENQAQALRKAESILGHSISTSRRKILIEEMVGDTEWQAKITQKSKEILDTLKA